MVKTDDERYMRLAIKQAEKAGLSLDVPVGAVIVKDGNVISAGYNRREQQKNALMHAEIEAIDAACKALGGWRLDGCTLYVTLEPCPMCAGAIINARIERVVYGAPDEKAGSFGSLINLAAVKFNHTPRITPGVLRNECAALLSDFFKNRRLDNTSNRPL